MGPFARGALWLPTAGLSGGRQFPLPSHILHGRCRSHMWNPCSFGQMFPQHHSGCLCVGPVGGRTSCLAQVSSPPAARMGLSKLKITHILKGEFLTPATCALPLPSLYLRRPPSVLVPLLPGTGAFLCSDQGLIP